MAVAFDQGNSTASVSASTVNVGPVTPAGSNRILMCTAVLADAGGSPGVDLTGLEHNGKTTKVDVFDSAIFGSYYRTHKSYILNPDAVSDNVTFTLSEAPDHGAVGFGVFNGVNQTTPVGTPVTKGPSTDDNPTVTLTDGVVGDMAVDLVGGDGQFLSISGGGTAIYTHEHISSYAGAGMGYEASTASTVRSWTWTDLDYYYGAVTMFMALNREQEGYRWRDDDGSESAATWLQAQEVNITRAVTTTTRLRGLLNYTGDPPSEQVKLQERKVGDPDSEWRDI